MMMFLIFIAACSRQSCTDPCRYSKEELIALRLHLEAGPFCPDGDFSLFDLLEVTQFLICAPRYFRIETPPYFNCQIWRNVSTWNLDMEIQRVVIELREYTEEWIDLFRNFILDSPMVAFDLFTWPHEGAIGVYPLTPPIIDF